MLAQRVILGGIVCLALVGLTALWAEPAPKPAPTISSAPTLPAAAAAEPSVTPSAIPTASVASSATPTAMATACATRATQPSATPSPWPLVVAATASPTPTAAWQSQPTAAEPPTSTPAATRPALHNRPQPPEPVAAPGVNVAAGIPYAVRPGADPRRTSLDVYAPPAASGLPVLIYVHGGGWSSGDKANVGAKAAYFTAHGFVFVSINYRLIPAAWPAQQATDVAAAVAWVKGNIRGYGGDGARVFMLGHSAGAHLTALVAADETYLREVGLEPGALRGVILLDSAAYDVEQLMRAPEGQADPFRAAFGDDPAQWPQVSPRAKVGPGKGTPPHLLLLSTPSGQRRPAAEGLAATLRAAGVYAHIVDACSFRNHISINDELGRAGDPATAVVQRFLDMLLRGGATGSGGHEVLRSPP